MPVAVSISMFEEGKPPNAPPVLARGSDPHGKRLKPDARLKLFFPVDG